MEVSSIFIALALAYLAIKYFKINVEIIFLYLIISIRLIPIIKNILSTYQSIRANIGSMEIVQEFFKEIDSKRDEVNYISQEYNNNFQTINNIKFSNINYSYTSGINNMVLKNINFEIKSNSFNLILGPQEL